MASTISFIDCINRGDVAALGRMMADDHALRVFDEAPLIGRRENIKGGADTPPTIPAMRFTPTGWRNTRAV